MCRGMAVGCVAGRPVPAIRRRESLTGVEQPSTADRRQVRADRACCRARGGGAQALAVLGTVAAAVAVVTGAGTPLTLASRRRTALAERPLAPSISSYSTFSPSFRERNPSPSMQLKCTKTSCPASLSRKPKPFFESNHLTIPVDISPTPTGRAPIETCRAAPSKTPERSHSARTAVLLTGRGAGLPTQTLPCWSFPSIGSTEMKVASHGPSPGAARCATFRTCSTCPDDVIRPVAQLRLWESKQEFNDLTYLQRKMGESLRLRSLTNGAGGPLPLELQRRGRRCGAGGGADRPHRCLGRARGRGPLLVRRLRVRGAASGSRTAPRAARALSRLRV